MPKEVVKSIHPEVNNEVSAGISTTDINMINEDIKL